jgi:CRISPR-associated protein Cas2
MEILVAYDVATDDAEGKRRLRRVAEVCQTFGQRVQKSVFECILNEAGFEILKHRLIAELEQTKDSVRIYRLTEPRVEHLYLIGKQPNFDIHDPLLI